MTSRHSPAVTWPVVPLRHWRRWRWGVGSALLGLLIAWTLQGSGWSSHPQALWRMALVWGVAVLTLALEQWLWRHQCRGSLRWDGRQWWWGAAHGAVVRWRDIRVLVDLQWMLVLQGTDDAGRSTTLWLHQQTAPHLWGDLRRAVYSVVPVSDTSGASP